MSDVSLSGVKIARVLNNQDEFGRERLFVRVLGVHNFEDIIKGTPDREYGIWVEHCAPSLYRTGDIPANDDEVYVLFFENNDSFDPNTGIWLGCVLKNNVST